MTEEANRIAQRLIKDLERTTKSYIAMAHESCRTGDPFEVTRWTRLYMRGERELHQLRIRWTPAMENEA